VIDKPFAVSARLWRLGLRLYLAAVVSAHDWLICLCRLAAAVKVGWEARYSSPRDDVRRWQWWRWWCGGWRRRAADDVLGTAAQDLASEQRPRTVTWRRQGRHLTNSPSQIIAHFAFYFTFKYVSVHSRLHIVHPVGEWSIVISMSVCLSVCPLAYPEHHTSKIHEIFYTCFRWPWLGPLTTMHYVM